MDCETARTLLVFSRPSGRELSGDEATVLEGHLTECSDCARQVQREQQLDAWLAPAMQAVPVPIDLRSRILGKLVVPKPVPASRRWARPLAFAAAAVLIVGLAAMGWSYFHRPAPDVESLVQEDKYYFPRTAEAAEKRFHDQYGMHIVAPTQFDYQFLVGQELQVHRDKKLPVLVFGRQLGDTVETARVYVFSDKDYDLSALPSVLPAVSGGCSVQKLPSANPHVVYVVLYTSERLEDFFPNTRTKEAA